MKKHAGRLAIAIFATAFAATAQANLQSPSAVMLNPRGLGQVLLYPYYTVNKGQDSYVSVVNGSDIGKVLRVTVREGYNGRSVLDFNLYLSPHDSWTAAISSSGNATDAARITTFDHSCVAPGVSFPTAFSTHGFDGSSDVGPADGGPATAARTREGHIEVIAMADIVPGSNTDHAIAPISNGAGETAPRDCGQLPSIPGADLVAPTSGLFGSGGIIKVSEGTYYAYAATALTGFTDSMLASNTADLEQASLASAKPVATLLMDNGGAVTLGFSRGIDAVSAALMSDVLYNEYLVGAGLGANTDWVVTFPTKRFYVDKQLYPSQQTTPFEVPFAAPGVSMVYVGDEAYDRESGVRTRRCAPGDVQCLYSIFRLPYEVNVISLRSDSESLPPPASSGVLGSALVIGRYAFGDAGWYEINFFALGPMESHQLTGYGLDPQIVASGVLNGLPAIGFMVYNVINTQAQPGKLANYGGLFPHRSSTSCTLTVQLVDPSTSPC